MNDSPKVVVEDVVRRIVSLENFREELLLRAIQFAEKQKSNFQSIITVKIRNFKAVPKNAALPRFSKNCAVREKA